MTPIAPPTRRLNLTVVRESAWLAGGFASKLAIQMGTLLYLTRTLGVAGTGTFFALVSLLACLTPFVQLGNYDLTVRDVARGVDPRRVAGRAMRSSAAAFGLLLPVVALLRPWVAPAVGWVPFLMLAAGELLVMRVAVNVQAVATGFRQHYVTAVSDFLIGLSRLAAVYAGYRLGAGVNLMLGLYAFTSVPATAVAYGWLVRRIGHPIYGGGSVFAGAGDHARMVVAWFAEMAAREGDKPLLAAVAGAADTGIYGTASKLLTVVLVPADILSQVFRPRISAAYGAGPAAGRRMHRLMLLALGGCGFVCGAGLLAVAVVAPHVVPRLTAGPFGQARVALAYLSLIPPLYGLQRANVIAAIARGATGGYAAAVLVSAAVGLTTLAATGHAYGWRAPCAALAAYMACSCLTTWWWGSTPRLNPTAEPADLTLPALEAAAA